MATYTHTVDNTNLSATRTYAGDELRRVTYTVTVTATQLGDPSNSIVRTFDILEVNCGVRFQDISTDPVHTVLMNSYDGTAKVINFPISAANNTPDECFNDQTLIDNAITLDGDFIINLAWAN